MSSVIGFHPDGRASFAFAAIALVLVISTVALAFQFRPDDEPVIPAVSERAGQGPSTSMGVDIMAWFAQAYSIDELAEYAVARWSCVEYLEGTIRPAERPVSSDEVVDAGTSTPSGMYFLTVTSGEFAVDLDTPAHLYHQDNSERTNVGPETVALQTGDTLISSRDILPAVWNSATANATYLAAALDDSQDHLQRPERVARGTGSGKLVISADLAGDVKSLEISIERIVIEPGETFAYAISPQTLLLATGTGGLLEKQAWVDGKPFGKPLKVGAQPITLSNYGTGYFTLTNLRAGPVTVSLFRVAPPDTGELVSPPSQPVDAPFGIWSLTQPVPAAD